MTAVPRAIIPANADAAPVRVAFLTASEIACLRTVACRPAGLVAQIVAQVAAESGFSVDQLVGRGRGAAPLAGARHVAMALVAARMPGLSLSQIGRMFGGRDHTTVAHGIARGRALLAAASEDLA